MPMTLKSVFESPSANIEGDWLYLTGDWHQWKLDSKACFPHIDPESGEPVLDEAHIQAGYRETLDLQTISDVVMWADRLSGKPNDAVRLESFVYYCRHDAFLPAIGAGDPPPASAVIHQLDLEFYNVLGTENDTKACRKDGCSRGTVQFSVFCRVHHFENIRNKPCPFSH